MENSTTDQPQETVTKPGPPPPPDPAILTPEQRQQLVTWLDLRWGAAACPFHGTTKWQVGDSLIGTTGFSPGGLRLGGPTYPLIAVTCLTCGYTVLVNALVAGVIPRPAASEVKEGHE